MTTLRNFAGSFNRVGREIEEGIRDSVNEMGADISDNLGRDTPVDTGLARGNWQASIGAPATADTSRLDPSGSVASAANAAIIRGRRSDADIHISNNLEYIGTLNQGSSQQAPAGFVEGATSRAVSDLPAKLSSRLSRIRG